MGWRSGHRTFRGAAVLRSAHSQEEPRSILGLDGCNLDGIRGVAGVHQHWLRGWSAASYRYSAAHDFRRWYLRDHYLGFHGLAH